MDYYARMDQRSTCGNCSVVNMPVCCEQACHYYKQAHREFGKLACAYCEMVMSCPTYSAQT